MRVIQTQSHYSDKEMETRFAGSLLTDNDYDHVVSDDCLVLKPDGTPLLIYCKGVLKADDCKAAYQNLRKAALEGDSDNRGMASGKLKVNGNIGELSAEDGNGSRFAPLKEDGSLSNTKYSLFSQRAASVAKRTGATFEIKRSDGTFTPMTPYNIPSGIVGYMDANKRFPYCRLTAFNLNDPEKFAAALPLIRGVDSVFKEHLPERYEAQRQVVERTSTDFYISGTVFTTITVNMNFQTAVHKDVGDLKAGFGVMSALRAGRFEGCYTVFPQYRVAANMQTGDVLLADVHEWHGNSPLHAKGKYERLSLVFYYREKIQECGTATEELERAKSTKGTTHLKDWQ